MANITKIKLENLTYNIKDELLSDKVIKNVLNFGAVGDGITDDTIAIVNALNSLNNNEALYFPAGDYIVYKDYVNNKNNPSYPIDKILKLVNKKNITLYGDGQSSRIRPALQGIADTKLNYPCTLTIDKCENIEIYNMCIESKGENYGDADAASSVAQNLRQVFVMSNGGVAILVSGSKKINIHDCNFRLCGSCGVVYHSDISDCLVKNCFANAASLGYAGFAIDDFCYRDTTQNHTIIYDSCYVNKETLVQPENSNVQIGNHVYSSKGGIVTEGSTSNILNVNILNSILKDSYGNSSNNFVEGCGILLQYSNGIIKNCIFENNFVGIKLINSSQSVNVKIENNNIISKYAGIVSVNLGNTTPVNNIDILYNNINILNTELPAPDPSYYLTKYAAIIMSENYSNNIYTIMYNKIKSLVMINFTRHIQELNCHYNEFNGTTGINTSGGGTFNITNNKLNINNSLAFSAIPYRK